MTTYVVDDEDFDDDDWYDPNEQAAYDAWAESPEGLNQRLAQLTETIMVLEAKLFVAQEVVDKFWQAMSSEDQEKLALSGMEPGPIF